MKKRVISAIVALAISVPLVYLGGVPFYVFALVLSLLGYREVINLIIKEESLSKQLSYVIFLCFVGSSINKMDFNNLVDFRVFGIVLILYSMILLLNHKNKKFDVMKGLALIGISIFIGTAFSTIIITRNIGLNYFIYLFCITIMTDMFAQFTGMLIGKHHINEISPNKSWEGCIGGAIFGTVLSSLFYILVINNNHVLVTILISLVLSTIGQIGDLFFSLIKRHFNIKDYSNIMPGHGGILDRLDSIMFVMLAFTYFITFL